MSKLDWMYKTSNAVDPEDYLLGKAIDKNFEAQGSSQNEVDKDILPTSIFANSSSNAPVDIVRKIKEDPLEQIKQKEIEMRKQLLKNPVKLKKLQSLLKAKAENKEHNASKKKKKSKTKDIDGRLSELLQKYGTKKAMELTKSDDSEDSDDDKYVSRRLKHSQSTDSSESTSLENEGKRTIDFGDKQKQHRKSKTSRKVGRKYSKDKRYKRSSSSSSSSDSSSLVRGRSRHSDGKRYSPKSRSSEISRNRKEKSSSELPDNEGLMRMIEKHGAKKLIELITDTSEEKRNTKKKRKKKDTSDSDEEYESEVTTHDSRETPTRKSNKQTYRRRDDSCSRNHEPTSENFLENKRRAVSPSSSSHNRGEDGHGRQQEHWSDEEKPSKKAYGLVLPKNIDAKRKLSSQPSEGPSPQKVQPSKSKFVRQKQHRLTEEEKAAKLKEMMDNAKWRDKERKTNVAKYREEEKREADNQTYDEGFMRKELSKAVESSNSVEERIKSKMNSVQRSKFSMSQNFARRN